MVFVMLLTKVPLRVSLLGGGTDLEDYYKHNFGMVVSFALNKFLYTTALNDKIFFLKYSKVEITNSINKINHPIIKEVLKYFNLSGLDLSVSSEIPAGTGLGSSSAFTVALIKTVSKIKNIEISPMQVAELACIIEIDTLQEPIGKQDQYAVSLGGMNSMMFTNEEVIVNQINPSLELIELIERRSLLVRIGSLRNASTVLSQQKLNMNNKKYLRILDEMKSLAVEFKKNYPKSIEFLPKLVTESWSLKKQLANDISNHLIEDFFNYALKFGSLGGKLLGAGSSGYVYLFFGYPEERQKFIQENQEKFSYIIPKISQNGASIVYDDN